MLVLVFYQKLSYTSNCTFLIQKTTSSAGNLWWYKAHYQTLAYSTTSPTTVGGQRRLASASSLLALGTSAEEEQEAFAIIVISVGGIKHQVPTIIINQLLSLNIAEGSDFVSYSQVFTTSATS